MEQSLSTTCGWSCSRPRVRLLLADLQASMSTLGADLTIKRHALEAEKRGIEAKLGNLYKAVEDGSVKDGGTA